VERPAKLDFLINMKNTQALGRRIPPSVAAQVTEWVQ
jgi:hypothetical protein